MKRGLISVSDREGKLRSRGAPNGTGRRPHWRRRCGLVSPSRAQRPRHVPQRTASGGVPFSAASALGDVHAHANKLDEVACRSREAGWPILWTFLSEPSAERFAGPLHSPFLKHRFDRECDGKGASPRDKSVQGLLKQVRFPFPRRTSQKSGNVPPTRKRFSIGSAPSPTADIGKPLRLRQAGPSLRRSSASLRLRSVMSEKTPSA